mmetsp:Transcript_59478/g.141406  ORF Transcript_59478/g.141406 Transcript_59478/m.141406 type:complete len:300 (-) Transcript_59478:277-1176(-)
MRLLSVSSCSSEWMWNVCSSGSSIASRAGGTGIACIVASVRAASAAVLAASAASSACSSSCALSSSASASDFSKARCASISKRISPDMCFLKFFTVSAWRCSASDCGCSTTPGCVNAGRDARAACSRTLTGGTGPPPDVTCRRAAPIALAEKCPNRTPDPETAGGGPEKVVMSLFWKRHAACCCTSASKGSSAGGPVTLSGTSLPMFLTCCDPSGAERDAALAEGLEVKKSHMPCLPSSMRPPTQSTEAIRGLVHHPGHARVGEWIRIFPEEAWYVKSAKAVATCCSDVATGPPRSTSS